ncbi:MAG TPA: signal peptidase I, partial [Cytophaga sp.]|nr:signal peptidase I [Cytophaga sp.]
MIKKRKPLLALLLALIPGLGQLYNGQAKKAAILVLIDFTLILFILYTQIFMSVVGLSIILSLVFGILIYKLSDAFIVARKNQHYELKRYNTWYVYLLFVAVIIIFQVIADETKTNTIRSFKIPTSSMEPTILVGDRIIAQVGFYKNNAVNRNDLIIFHYPAETDKPIDEKTHYVSRCVAIPGDTLSIRNKQVYINNQPSIIPTEVKHKFKCYTNNILSEIVKKKYGVRSYDMFGNELLESNGKKLYLIDLSTENVKKLRSSNAFDSIVDFKLQELDQNTMLFPYTHVSYR